MDVMLCVGPNVVPGVMLDVFLGVMLGMGPNVLVEDVPAEVAAHPKVLLPSAFMIPCINITL